MVLLARETGNSVQLYLTGQDTRMWKVLPCGTCRLHISVLSSSQNLPFNSEVASSPAPGLLCPVVTAALYPASTPLSTFLSHTSPPLWSPLSLHSASCGVCPGRLLTKPRPVYVFLSQLTVVMLTLRRFSVKALTEME